MEEYNVSLDDSIHKILNDNKEVVGEIYLITNTINGKQYIGQTMSHRLNHKKYRPFGFKKRFDDHCSGARTTITKTQYITNSIRKYGEAAFQVQLVIRCLKEETDMYEEYYIKQYDTLYPIGYNLTTGGKHTIFVPVKKVGNDHHHKFTKQYREHQKEETKEKISQALKTLFTSECNVQQLRQRGIEQHDKNRLKLFTGCLVDLSNLDKYIRKKNNKNNVQYIVKIDDKVTTFYGPKQEDESVKNRALKFLSTLQQHNQIAGNP